MIGKTNAISGVSAPVPKIKTVSGSVISISDALAQPAESLVVGIEPVQSGSGDPSPSNIRPISGWSNVNVYREAQYDAGATPYATISLNGTVYGGSLDVTTGVLTVDRAIVDITTKSTSGWTKSSSYPGGFYITKEGFNTKYGVKPKMNIPFICSHAKTVEMLADYAVGTCFSDGSTNIRIMSAGSSVQDWIDYLVDQSNNGTPVQVCMILDEPQTVQLSPTTVQMLLGNNVLWADSGDIELQYWARR